MHLLRLEIFLNAPWPEFAAEARLLVSAPWSFNVCRLHVIHPHNARAYRFYRTERFVDVARPHRRRQTIGGIISDSDCILFVFERNYCRDRTENFLASDSRRVGHVVK